MPNISIILLTILDCFAISLLFTLSMASALFGTILFLTGITHVQIKGILGGLALILTAIGLTFLLVYLKTTGML